MAGAQKWIDRLQLQRHPEGGWFRETYRSEEVVAATALPSRFGGSRALATAIYFLLEGEDFSALHRLKADEVWHFYDGCGVTLHIFAADGNYTTVSLGRELPQAVVRADTLFGATVTDGHSFALVGCTLAPGFDFADFQMPDRDELCRMYPKHRQLIERLTR
jgi:predicted cupin superfamily sugar epimerase